MSSLDGKASDDPVVAWDCTESCSEADAPILHPIHIYNIRNIPMGLLVPMGTGVGVFEQCTVPRNGGGSYCGSGDDDMLLFDERNT